MKGASLECGRGRIIELTVFNKLLGFCEFDAKRFEKYLDLESFYGFNKFFPKILNVLKSNNYFAHKAKKGCARSVLND